MGMFFHGPLFCDSCTCGRQSAQFMFKMYTTRGERKGSIRGHAKNRHKGCSREFQHSGRSKQEPIYNWNPRCTNLWQPALDFL